MKTLNLVDKKHQKKYIQNKKHNASNDTKGLYGADGSLAAIIENILNNSGYSDERKQYEISSYINEYYEEDEINRLQVYIDDMLSMLNLDDAKYYSLYKKSRNDISGIVNATTDEGSTLPESRHAAAWDPRLIRIDGFLATQKNSPGQIIVPFASDTAASAYFDEVFTIEKAAYEEATNQKVNTLSSGGDKIATNKAQVEELKKDGNMYGVQSLINPYCVTRLVGGITNVNSDNKEVHMYDIRDTKRFYDTANVKGDSIVMNPDDFTSINNPTTSNIINWSNKDQWGRTPYSFQDFVFCKFWNIIPNNRLITFRKYAVPVYDNLQFYNMLNDSGTEATHNIASPIATVVTYFGGDSANKLNDFLKFSSGTKWKEISADIHKIEGDVGSNPRAVIDKMFESGGGFAGISSGSGIVTNFLGAMGGLTGQYLSFGKFVGLLSPNGYDGHNQAAWEHLTSANMDPTESLYSNKIVGPVNRIQSVQARDAGIEFSQSFTLTCEYVARPIGGINTKAAMLDILSNAMEIASADAVFWGGGYRFNIKPHMYPFKRGTGTGSMMDALYAGNIFGKNGAIAKGLEGFLSFGKKVSTDSATSSIEWSILTERMGNILSQTVGAIGGMLQSIGSALMGSLSTVGSWFNKAGDVANNIAGEDAAQKGRDALSNMFNNLNSMWKDQVIQETVLPNVSGLRSLLSGEPTGNWHLTIGNPLNPMMVVGNLICKKMDVSFGDELGPDDFPLEMKVVYTIEHAMARDKAAIQSMFNRGAGKIYKLPDYVKAVSNYETKVDPFTGGRDVMTENGWVTPEYMTQARAMEMIGARGYQVFKIPPGKELQNHGNADTTLIAKFMPVDPEQAFQTVSTTSANLFLGNSSNRVRILGNLFTRKSSNN